MKLKLYLSNGTLCERMDGWRPFNDGNRFRWTAQAQLISKVYLKKHPTLPRCYNLNAKDKKMVNNFWRARGHT